MTDTGHKADRQRALLALALATRDVPQAQEQSCINAEELAAFFDRRLDDPATEARVLRALAHDPVVWHAWLNLRRATDGIERRTSPMAVTAEPWLERLRLWFLDHLFVAVPTALVLVLGIPFMTQLFLQSSSTQSDGSSGVGFSEITLEHLPDRALLASAWKRLLPTLRNSLPKSSAGLSVTDTRTDAFASGVRDVALMLELLDLAPATEPAEPCEDRACEEMREWGKRFGLWAFRMSAACGSADPAVQSLRPTASDQEPLSRQQRLWRSEKRLPVGLGPIPEPTDGDAVCRYARTLVLRALITG